MSGTCNENNGWKPKTFDDGIKAFNSFIFNSKCTNIQCLQNVDINTLKKYTQ